jgi:hypothetical protein
MKPFERSSRIIFAGLEILPPQTTLKGGKIHGFRRLYKRLVKTSQEGISELVDGQFIDEFHLTEHERTLLIIAQTAMQQLERSTRQRMSENDKRFWRINEILIPKEANEHKDELL